MCSGFKHNILQENVFSSEKKICITEQSFVQPNYLMAVALTMWSQASSRKADSQACPPP